MSSVIIPPRRLNPYFVQKTGRPSLQQKPLLPFQRSSESIKDKIDRLEQITNKLTEWKTLLSKSRKNSPQYKLLLVNMIKADDEFIALGNEINTLMAKRIDSAIKRLK